MRARAHPYIITHLMTRFVNVNNKYEYNEQTYKIHDLRLLQERNDSGPAAPSFVNSVSNDSLCSKQRGIVLGIAHACSRAKIELELLREKRLRLESTAYAELTPRLYSYVLDLANRPAQFVDAGSCTSCTIRIESCM